VLSYLVLVFDVAELLPELLVVNERLKLVQQSQVLQELVTTELGCNKLGELGIGLVQPSARCNTIGDVCELIGSVDLHKVLEDGGLDEIRVQFSHTVDLVGAYQGEVGHADHLRLGFFDNRNAAEQFAVAGKVALDELEEIQVYVIHYLLESQSTVALEKDGARKTYKVTGKKVLHQWDRPLLKRLRQDGMVGVAECLLDNWKALVLSSS
jgi:hypothetical protein